MRQRTFKLPQMLTSLGFAMAATGILHAAPQPNIIFMISDDHRWDCLGAAGNPNISTPNLDKVAREGVYFAQGTIHNPQCSPSRAALLTGMTSQSNGRFSNQSIRKEDWQPEGSKNFTYMPETLKKAGYHTAFSGKWHIAVDPWNCGFEDIGKWMPAGMGPYQNAPIAEGKSRATTNNPEFTQQVFGDSARAQIKAHADSKTTQPLFLWLALTAPHGPYQPNPESAMAPYKGKGVKDVLPPTYKGNLEAATAKKWVEYATAITSADEEVGKVMKTLKETGMDSNTVFVFIGDNGYMMGNRDWNGKVVPYEDSVRVPFIIWGPGVIQGKGKTEASASSLDLPVTFAKLAGANVPTKWHGRDLTPVLKDAQPHDITWSVSEAPDYDNWKFPEVSYRTVRTTESKLIVWHKKMNKAPEFYDISKDPQEQTNLYADAAYKPRVDALQKLLDDYMKKTGDDWEMHGALDKTDQPGKNKKGKNKKTDDE